MDQEKYDRIAASSDMGQPPIRNCRSKKHDV